MPTIMEPRTPLAISTHMIMPPTMPSHMVALRITPALEHW